MPISFITNQLYIKLTLKHVNFIVTRLKFMNKNTFSFIFTFEDIKYKAK